jgi:hypothetical protein
MLIRDNRPLCYPLDRRMLVSVPRVSAADGEETDATPAGVAILPSFNMHAITPKGLERYHCAPNVWANVSESPYLADIGIGERRCILTGNL